MTIVLTIIHVIVCFFLVVVVLLQSGKAADLAGAFGGMGSQTAFGPRGSATVLSKATTIAAAMFMVTSLTLAILATRHAAASGSVLERQKATAAKAGSAKPAAPTGTPSVTVTPEGGKPQTIPLNLPGQPGTKLPAAKQPPATQPPAPPKK
ncbi:MAG TPA: preprotein translocase subunit SecG [Bryobacteraceae bacterium]|jgi:preprotein translocase subunit SecG|nr:preprotein translocase subunit SecG [Bryobacteraceae bacterium]